MDQDTTCLPVETRRPEDTVSTPAEKSLAFEAVITSIQDKHICSIRPLRFVLTPREISRPEQRYWLRSGMKEFLVAGICRS
jgi:hypothetical protein